MVPLRLLPSHARLTLLLVLILDSYPESATSAEVLVTDECIRSSKTVIVNVDNGRDTISIDVDVVSTGEVVLALTSAPNDNSDTIAIKDGDVLTVTYTGASGVTQSDTGPYNRGLG